MTTHNRTEKVQHRLNEHMRRQDVLEEALFRSLNAEPASEIQVRSFLAEAPPEIFVLLAGLVGPPSPAGVHNEEMHENRIVQGFVGTILAGKKRARQATVS